MRKYLIILLSAAGLMGIFYGYSVYTARQDDLDVALREENFLRLKPPSTLNTVGALYFIGWWEMPNVSTPICSPPKEILAKYLQHSEGEAIGGTRTFQGTYTSRIKANAGQPINGKGSLDDKRFITARYRLTDVNYDQIELGPSAELYKQLMETKSCSDVVTKYLTSGYVCQDYRLLRASAVFERDSETDTGANLDLDTKKALAAEMETALGAHVIVKEGVIVNERRSEAGKGLQWGIQMTPLCLAPKEARFFQRTLPQNIFEKWVNFIKFTILEPILEHILPATT